MASYVPPLRESIEDHLRVARKRWWIPSVPWPPNAISVAFVGDLIKKGIIGGPKAAGPKKCGRGVARRFRPADYRDLLHVITLKLMGVKHKSGWILDLWLRGRNIPIEDARQALINELQPVIDTAKRDIAPTGRWTEPFGKKYDRRVRSTEEADDGSVDAMEVFAALMIRPKALSEITPDVPNLSETLAAIAKTSSETLQPFLEELVDSTKQGRAVDLDLAQQFSAELERSEIGPLFAALMPVVQSEGESIMRSLSGALDDGSGNSTLVAALRGASEESLLRAREVYQITRSGHIEDCLRQARAQCPLHLVPLLTLLEPIMKSQRLTMRWSPKFSAHIFALYLRSLQD